jgi:hypothetical protein
MEEWPSWRPSAGEQARPGPLPIFVTGGPQNPMGARGLYLYLGGQDMQYRIHCTNQPEYTGRARSSGCIRLTNEDVIDLYNRVKVGTTVVVLGPTNRYLSSGPHHGVDGKGPKPWSEMRDHDAATENCGERWHARRDSL